MGYTEIDAGPYQWYHCENCDEMVPWDHTCYNDPAHPYVIANVFNPHTGKTEQQYIELSPEAQEEHKGLFK